MGVRVRNYSSRQGALKRKMHVSLIKRVRKSPITVRVRLKPKTGTATLNKTRKVRAKALPTRAGTEDVIRIVAKPKRLINKLGQQINNSHLQSSSSVIANSSVGLQEYVQLQNILDYTDLNTMLANCSQRDGTLSFLNTNYLATNSGMLTTTIQVNSCKSECMITNNGNSVMRLILHDAMPKANIFTNIQNATNTPVNSVIYGIAHETNSGDLNTYKQLATKPTDSKLFNNNWKIIKTTYTELAPGQTHYHRITYAPYKRINMELIHTPNFLMARKYGISTFCQIYGQPVTDNNTTGATVQRTDLACVCKKSYNYSWIEPDKSFNDIISTVQTTASTGAINLVTGILNSYIHG